MNDAAALRAVRRRLLLLAGVGVVVASAARTLVTVPLGLSCPASGVCVTVDDEGNARRLRDGTWSSTRVPLRTSLDGVSCPDVAFCAAVTSNGAVTVLGPVRWSPPRVVDRQAA